MHTHKTTYAHAYTHTHTHIYIHKHSHILTPNVHLQIQKHPKIYMICFKVRDGTKIRQNTLWIHFLSFWYYITLWVFIFFVTNRYWHILMITVRKRPLKKTVFLFSTQNRKQNIVLLCFQYADLKNINISIFSVSNSTLACLELTF